MPEAEKQNDRTWVRSVINGLQRQHAALGEKFQARIAIVVQRCRLDGALVRF